MSRSSSTGRNCNQQCLKASNSSISGNRSESPCSMRCESAQSNDFADTFIYLYPLLSGEIIAGKLPKPKTVCSCATSTIYFAAKSLVRTSLGSRATFRFNARASRLDNCLPSLTRSLESRIEPSVDVHSMTFYLGFN